MGRRSAASSLKAHTRAKHQILRRYLSAWFGILGSGGRYARIVYIDGFSGPGEYEGGQPGSPLIALNAASEHARTGRLRAEAVFWFIERSRSCAEHLKEAVARRKWPEAFKIYVQRGECAAVLNSALDELESARLQTAPTFAFLDPFGVSGVPFALVRRLLERKSCEVFMNCQTRAAARCLKSPVVATRNRVVEQIGSPDVLGLAGAPGRISDAVRDRYHEQLHDVVPFVCSFRIRAGPVMYDLFLATTRSLGFVRMKEAMWAVDPSGRFQFSPPARPGQRPLFPLPPDLSGLRARLVGQFGGATVSGKAVKEFVLHNTEYVERHKTQVLREMEGTHLTVRPTKLDGRPRLAGSFPEDCAICFRHEGDTRQRLDGPSG